MALVVNQKGVHIGHRDYEPGELIPKSYETDPTHDFSSSLSVGRVSWFPDGAFSGGVPQTPYLDSHEDAHRISKLLDEQDDSVGFRDFHDVDLLDVAIRREKNNLNRSDVVEKLETRKDEILDEFSGEGE